MVFTDDSIPELDESFFVDLSAPQGGCSIVDPSATVTIFGKSISSSVLPLYDMICPQPLMETSLRQ